jgi:hypothetical protein
LTACHAGSLPVRSRSDLGRGRAEREDLTMKCSSCYALNAPNDTACAACGTPLRQPANIVLVPGWAYFFAIACAVIPVASIGGLIPIGIGIGGAGACVKVSSMGSLPQPARLLACVLITAACWGLFIAMFGALLATVYLGKRHHH